MIIALTNIGNYDEYEFDSRYSVCTRLPTYCASRPLNKFVMITCLATYDSKGYTKNMIPHKTPRAKLIAVAVVNSESTASLGSGKLLNISMNTNDRSE